jgi:phage replication initiation protein
VTRAKKSDLVLDGREVAFRLKAERQQSKGLVHVDWVRFTVRVKQQGYRTAWCTDLPERLEKLLSELPNPEWAISVQAHELATEAAQALGPDFTVAQEQRKGHDFYRFRWSIERNGTECGWVGYLASGDGPKQQAQATTMHVNLYGTACTFAQPGFNHRVADLVRKRDGVLTRVDLALDYFDGLSGGMERVKSDYMAGLMDHFGNRPKCNLVGDWCNGRARSFYFGSKEAGKQTNVYEKGHQLFGPKDDSPWMRVELRYGNKQRVLDADMLNRPDDFFAGASDWHASMLREAGATSAPEPVTTKPRLAVESILAEVKRNVRWLRDTAAPSLALAFQYLGENMFLDLVEHQKLPGRLCKFTQNEISDAYKKAFQTLKGSSTGRAGMQSYSMA